MSVGALSPRVPPAPVTGARPSHAASLVRRTVLPLAFFILAAAVLRFFRLGHQGFWFDEGNTALEVHFTAGQMLTLLKHYESTPPLYYGVAWIWSRIFGDTELALRSLSALAGVLAVPVAFGAAAKLVSRRAGFIAAALVTFSPYLIWYSQEARAYSLAVLLVAGTLLAFAYARSNPSAGAMAAWTVLCGLALTTEYYAALVVIPEALWLLYVHRRRREVWAGMAALALWSAPLLWFAISQNATGHASWIAPIPLAPRLGQIIPQFLVGYGGPALGVLERVAEAAALIGLVLLLTRTERPARSGALLAGGIAMAGLIINLILIAGGIDDLITRNVISLWMPAAIALAGGLAAARARRVGLAATIVLCAIGVTMAGAVAFDQSLQRPDWRKLAHLLGSEPARGTPGRAILLQRYRTLLPLSLYLPDLQFLRYRRGHPHSGQATVSELDVVAMQAPRVNLCWWGAVCNLEPSALRSAYPVPGFRVLGRRSVYPFMVERLVPTSGRATITIAQGRAYLGVRPHGNKLLVQLAPPSEH